MAITTTLTTLGQWVVDGVDAYDAPERTTLLVVENPDWTEDTADDYFRYMVIEYVADPSEGFLGDEDDWSNYEYDHSDDLSAALASAQERADQARADYATVAQDGRDCRATDLLDCCDWQGEEHDAVAALAGLIRSGRAADALAALRTAGLV